MGNPAFVGGNYLQFRQSLSVFEFAGNAYVPEPNDVDSLILFMSDAPSTITIPADSALDLPVGAMMSAMRAGTGTLTAVPGAGVTFREQDGATRTVRRWAWMTFTKIGANTWVLDGGAWESTP